MCIHVNVLYVILDTFVILLDTVTKVCDGCHDFIMEVMSFNEVAIVSATYRIYRMIVGVKYIKGRMQQDFIHEKTSSFPSQARTFLEIACILEEIVYFT